MWKKTITIAGTHCPSCKALIEDIAKDVQGITSCKVDFKTGETEIEYNEKLDWNTLKQEIEYLEEYKVIAL